MSSGYTSFNSIAEDMLNFGQQATPENSENIKPLNTVKRGILYFSPKTLRKLLNLPDDCEIVAAISDYSRANQIGFAIESPNCPEVPEGGQIPIITKETLTGFDE